MDIRFINRGGEIINASNLSIKRMKKNIVGINERQEVINIEKYKTEEEAKENMKGIINIISEATSKQAGAIVIQT